MHRFMWDVHLQPLPGAGGGRGGGAGLPMQAIPFNTGSAPTTPWANPGTYTVKLTVDGRTYSQPITVKQDPRVKTPALVMQEVYSLTKAMYDGAVDAQAAAAQAQALRDQITALQPQAKGAAAEGLSALERKVVPLVLSPVGPITGPPGGGGRGGRGGGPAAPPTTLSGVASGLSGLMNSLQAADVEPTANVIAAIAAARANAGQVMARWATVKTVDVPAVNAQLRAAGLAGLTVK
jgi:hypothetical protein